MAKGQKRSTREARKPKKGSSNVTKPAVSGRPAAPPMPLSSQKNSSAT
jgi:hypothetical protein